MPQPIAHVARDIAPHVTACGFGFAAAPSAIAVDYSPSKGYTRRDNGEAFPFQQVCSICRKRCLPTDEGALWGIKGHVGL